MYLAFCSARLHATDVYYVEYPYSLTALIFITMGIFSLLCAGYGALRRSFYGRIFVGPLALGLATMVYIPNGMPHVQRSMVRDTDYLSDVGSFLRSWYKAHQHFPRDQAEFLAALKEGAQYRIWPPSSMSFYSHRGLRLPYEVVVVNNAIGPSLDHLSPRPGVVYYCVRNDFQQFWVTMTGLNEDLERIAQLKRVADLPSEKPWIITAKGKDYLPARNSSQTF